jgi:hypothetical protein
MLFESVSIFRRVLLKEISAILTEVCHTPYHFQEEGLVVAK